MILKFLIERRSWIVFFLLIQILTIFVTILDSTIPIHSVLYIVFLSFILFKLFLFTRYHRETKYYKRLLKWEENLDLNSLKEARTPYEKIIETSILNQTDQLKKEALTNIKSLEQEKDELLSWIHEIKTPLTAMHLMIDRLEDEKIKSSLTYEWLRIHLLLDQQLHQKRLPFIENDLYIENVDLKALIYKEVKTIQSWCIQKGLGVEIELKVTEVLSDSKWLSYIIRQLLTNAVKYSSESDIIITSYERNDQVILEVVDHGCGIDPKDTSRIFEKGFTTTARYRENTATGMGLYLAKKAANQLSIHIEVVSKVNEGSTFKLVFPRRNEFLNIKRM